MSLYLGKEKVGASFMGAGNPIAEDNDVIFIDYDGTIRYSYSADEFLALTELPPNPHHAGLVAQGWNWTLEDAKEYVEKYGGQIIGQLYTTSDNRAHIKVSVTNDVQPSITLNFIASSNATITIDWGDRKTSTVTGSGVLTATHIWDNLGDYDVSCTFSDVAAVGFGKNVDGGGLFGPDDVSQASGREVYAPNSVQLYRAFALLRSRTVEAVSFDGATGFYASSTFHSCNNLKALVFNATGRACTSGQFQYCYALKYISARKYDSTLGGFCFYQAVTLRRLWLTEDVTAISNYFINTSSLTQLAIPSSCRTIAANAIYAPLYHLSFHSETPPTLSASSAFSGLAGTCVIFVPYASLAAYLSATNYPNPATYTYVGFAAFVGGVTLPTQDSAQAYNVVWYASKVDAIAQTNAITVGNGQEIYCRYTEVSE